MWRPSSARPSPRGSSPGACCGCRALTARATTSPTRRILDALEAEERVAFRYCDAAGAVTPEANPNGSLRNIAGVLNERRNVLGMMPHPERAADALLGGEDGNAIWESILASRSVAAAPA